MSHDYTALLKCSKPLLQTTTDDVLSNLWQQIKDMFDFHALLLSNCQQQIMEYKDSSQQEF